MWRLLMENKQEEKESLRELFRTQKLCVLSTLSQNHPYANLVGFWSNDELDEIIFATVRATQKYLNISKNSHVAVLIDSRSNKDYDFLSAIAATAIGKSEEVSGIERDQLQSLFLEKHPNLVEFVSSPSSALMRINVESYFIVNNFQNVVELHIR